MADPHERPSLAALLLAAIELDDAGVFTPGEEGVNEIVDFVVEAGRAG